MLMLGDTEIEAGLNWNALQFNLRQPVRQCFSPFSSQT